MPPRKSRLLIFAPDKKDLACTPVSPYASHCEEWRDGCGSEACKRAKHKCFLRGRVPCDILFIGEAPGESEDVLGSPFVGPAGKLMDRIIDKALSIPGTTGPGYHTMTHGLTNLVACIPREEDGGKAVEPGPEQIQSCAPRLREIAQMCRPRLIVCVGALSRDHLMKTGYKHTIKLGVAAKMIDIVHPAAILRANVAHQGLAVQKCVAAISTAVADILEELNEQPS